jgi:hypothetical protein
VTTDVRSDRHRLHDAVARVSELPHRVAEFAHGHSPIDLIAIDFDGLELDLHPADLESVRERPWPRWPTPWPGYRGGTAA